MPLISLFLVENEPHVECDLRMAAAQVILAIPHDELDESPYMDFGLKLVTTYNEDLKVAAETGRCPMPLYVYLLLVRKELDCQTQDVEGMNSTLQVITALAPNVRIGLASDRIQVNVFRCLIKQDDSLNVVQLGKVLQRFNDVHLKRLRRLV